MGRNGRRANFETEWSALAALARSLTDEQWRAPSLCSEWSVRDVVVHVAFHIHRTGVRDAVGNLEAATARHVAEQHAETTDGLLAWLESDVSDASARSTINLSEVVIHQQDVRRALGMPRSTPEAAARRSLRLCTTVRGNLLVIGRRRRLGHGLRLTATDIDWTSGHGPEVNGTADDILLAVAGRRVAIDGLTGTGAAILHARADPASKPNEVRA